MDENHVGFVIEPMVKLVKLLSPSVTALGDVGDMRIVIILRK